MLKVAADVTTRTVRVIRTDGQDLEEHVAINKALLHLQACGRYAFQFRDCRRQNYDTIDVRFEL
jgi:hypothetical protein